MSGTAKTIAILAAAFLISAGISTYVTTLVYQNDGSTGYKTYLKIYLDEAECTNSTTIEWGEKLAIGESYYYECKAENPTDTPIMVILEITGLDSWLSLTWTNATDHDLNGAIIEPFSSVIGNLTLTVDPTAPEGTQFSFTTTFYADDMT